ncbi:hypothetical protein HOY80DRAFT_1025442 [Tuber brumale]|nr:hypothetical protein HOY80DRAFT_1025442 [Tuber brumale]
MGRSKRGRKAENRRKHSGKGNMDKFFVASESDVDTASDRGGPVTDDTDGPVRKAIDGVAGFKLGVSASSSKGAFNGDCGLDDHKSKADTAGKNKAGRAETTGKHYPQLRHLLENLGVGAGSKGGPALVQGFVEGVNEADGACQEKAGESSHANSNQSFGLRGPKGRVGDRSQRGTSRKHARPNIALTKQEEALIAKAGLPMYLMPAVSEVIESRRNYEFLRQPNESGKARILFEHALARHGLTHAPGDVDPRLFPKNANSKGVPSKRPDESNVDVLLRELSQEELPTSMKVEKGHSGTGGYVQSCSSYSNLCP